MTLSPRCRAFSILAAGLLLSRVVRYDHHPLPGIEKTDVTTAISLVYKLL